MGDGANSADTGPGTAARRFQLGDPEQIEAALRAGEPIRVLLHARGALRPEIERLVELAGACGVETIAVGDRELSRIAARSGHPSVLACLGPDPARDIEGLFAGEDTNGGREAVWLLVGTAYPGNAGFVIRTAEVSGANGVVIDADFDRTARRDAARAAMRADRYLPVLFESAETAIGHARGAGHRVIVVEDTGTLAPWDVDLCGPVLFVVGGEEHGVPLAIQRDADAVVRIPMRGFMSAYNLQAAMAAVMAERLRQEALERSRD